MINNADILLIDEDPNDTLIISNVISKFNPSLNLKTVQNYLDAIEYLFLESSVDPYSNLQLILLEINLSERKGISLLQTIKENPELKKIPLIVLTRSNNEKDIRFCYQQHVNAFVQKPKTKAELNVLLETILKFWIEVVSRPEHAWS